MVSDSIVVAFLAALSASSLRDLECVMQLPKDLLNDLTQRIDADDFHVS